MKNKWPKSNRFCKISPTYGKKIADATLVGTLHIEDKYKYILHVHIIRYAFGDDIDRSQMRCGLFYLDH